MGTVYRARDTELAREVALKRIAIDRPGPAGRRSIEESTVRLRREAQAMARIDHPGVVRIYDAGIVEGQLFVAMELVGGGTLVDWMNERRRSWREVVNVMIAAGRGLAAAHRAGLVHRDIKPGNILVDECGVAKVTDFGLARSPGEQVEVPSADGALLDLTITRSGTVAGTPAYMAPEQLAGGVVDARADQFSFCVALWEALCGARPFIEHSTVQRRRAGRGQPQRQAIVEPVERAGVPRWLLSLVRRGLAIDPAARWPSMSELLDALERAARPSPVLRGAVGLSALVTCAALVTGGLPFSEEDEPRIPELQTGLSVRKEYNARPFTFTLLPDGRYLQTDGVSLAVSHDLDRWRPFSAPEGWRIIAAHPSSFSGHALVYMKEKGRDDCRWWLSPVDGGQWEGLIDDAGCARRVAVAVSPDGRQVAIASERGLLLTWRSEERASQRLSISKAHLRGDLHDRRLSSQPVRESIPVWSPDGARIAVTIDKKVVIFDIGSGRSRTLEAATSKPQWLDAERLIYVTQLSISRWELRMFDVAADERSLVHQEEGQIREIFLAPSGLLLMRQRPEVGLYTVKLSGAGVRALHQLVPVQTGAERDFEPAGWSADGALISFGIVNGKRSLIRTALGARGAPLVQRGAPAFLNGPASTGRVLYGAGSEGRYGLWSYDLATGKDHYWREDAGVELVHMTCALLAPRCYLRDSPGAWLDPVAMAFTGEAPTLDREEVLSPDGQETARVRGTQVILRDLASNAEIGVQPQPPITGRMEVHWGADRDSLLLLTSRPHEDSQAEGHHRLLLMDRDGHWRALVEDEAHTISKLEPSPDRKRLAFAAQRTETTWLYYRFHSARR